MNEIGIIEFDRKVTEAIHHIRELTEWAKNDWLTRIGKPMRLLGVDDKALRECEWARAGMWVCALEHGGAQEDADLFILCGLWHTAFMIERGLMDTDGEMIGY